MQIMEATRLAVQKVNELELIPGVTLGRVRELENREFSVPFFALFGSSLHLWSVP